MFWLLTWSSGKDVSGIQNINTIKKRQGKQKKTALSLSIFVVCSKTKSILGCLALSRKTKNWGKQTNSKTNRIPGWSQKKFFCLFSLGFLSCWFIQVKVVSFRKYFFSLKFVIPMCTSSTPRKHMCAPSWPFGKLLKPLGKKQRRKEVSKGFCFWSGAG